MYRIFTGGTAGRGVGRGVWGVGLTTHPHLECRGPRKSKAIPLLTLRVCVAYKKGENLPIIKQLMFSESAVPLR